ncbi:MAG: RNA methyltransferase [Chitinophagales bacterium]|nr:RNA methyltransferase [Chitinophagales bacterium]
MRKLATTELSRKNIDEFKNTTRLPVIVVLDNVRSAHNVGSVFRTCDAFAVEKIYLCGISASPPNREVMKTAIGSTESVEWIYFTSVEEAIQFLKKSDYQIILIEQTDESISLEKFIPLKEKKYALVFGNEVSGVSDEILSLAHVAVEIPQFGTKHSFNISVSAGIVLWELFKKLK